MASQYDKYLQRNKKTTWAAAGTASATFNSRWLTTATGKLGYAWDRVLLYGKAGGAWVGANNPNLTVNGAGQRSPVAPPTISAGLPVSGSSGHSRAVGQREPNTISSGCKTRPNGACSGDPFGGDTININNRNISMFTAGLNYKFGGWGY